jgi:formyltetrahydrofolate synthetase
MEQIDIMSKCQDFRVSHQIKLTNNNKEWAICGARTQKHGKYNSEFHSIFSDHKVEIQRLKCKGGCNLAYKLEGIFGTRIHPRFIKKTSLF